MTEPTQIQIQVCDDYSKHQILHNATIVKSLNINLNS